ncbi:MAG: VanZ family protein [Ruminococcaceae bacterium]|nr:VanZ family protein [Oscillospiraceae bacterium]
MGGLFARLLLSALIALPVYALVRFLYLRTKKKPWAWPRELILCLFVVFMVGLLALVFQPATNYNVNSGASIPTVFQRFASWQDINLIPFTTIAGYFTAGLDTRFVVNIVANVLMFSPLGFCLPLLWRRWQSALKTIGLGLGFSVLIECTQLFIGRSVDVDDVILNTLGVAIGYGLYALFRKKLPKALALPTAP